jgi:hypothetical protein
VLSFLVLCALIPAPALQWQVAKICALKGRRRRKKKATYLLWPLAFSWTHGLHPFSRWLLLAAPGDYWHGVVGLWLGWVLRENRLWTDCALVCGGSGVVGAGRHGIGANSG